MCMIPEQYTIRCPDLYSNLRDTVKLNSAIITLCSFFYLTVKFSAFAGKGRLDKDERRHARITLLIAHGLALFNYPVTGSGTGEASRSVFFSSYVHRSSGPLSGALLCRAAAFPCRSAGVAATAEHLVHGSYRCSACGVLNYMYVMQHQIRYSLQKVRSASPVHPSPLQQGASAMTITDRNGPRERKSRKTTSGKTFGLLASDKQLSQFLTLHPAFVTWDQSALLTSS